MGEFERALLSCERSPLISEEDDWFAPLIGDWSFDYFEPGGRQLKGEWFFRYVLEGTAVEDIFICPSRDTKELNPQPDAEYGVAVRMYNQARRSYDMTYVCTKYIRRLEVRREQVQIVCTVLEQPSERWRFLEIGENTFRWQNVTILDNGEPRVNCEVFASRIGA